MNSHKLPDTPDEPTRRSMLCGVEGAGRAKAGFRWVTVPLLKNESAQSFRTLAFVPAVQSPTILVIRCQLIERLSEHLTMDDLQRFDEQTALISRLIGMAREEVAETDGSFRLPLPFFSRIRSDQLWLTMHDGYAVIGESESATLLPDTQLETLRQLWT